MVTGGSTNKKQSPATPRTPGPKLNNDLVADLVRQVIEVLQPIIIKTVATAVTAAMDSVMEGLRKLTPPPPPPPPPPPTPSAAASAQTNVLRFEVDRLEQYSRRENIKIRGLPVTAGEDTSDVVVKLGK